jgi:hypothetical protein
MIRELRGGRCDTSRMFRRRALNTRFSSGQTNQTPAASLISMRPPKAVLLAGQALQIRSPANTLLLAIYWLFTGYIITSQQPKTRL